MASEIKIPAWILTIVLPIATLIGGMFIQGIHQEVRNDYYEDQFAPRDLAAMRSAVEMNTTRNLEDKQANLSIIALQQKQAAAEQRLDVLTTRIEVVETKTTDRYTSKQAKADREIDYFRHDLKFEAISKENKQHSQAIEKLTAVVQNTAEQVSELRGQIRTLLEMNRKKKSRNNG